MATRYDTYAYIDLETLADHRSNAEESDESRPPFVDAKRSCRGKTLLLWSDKGVDGPGPATVALKILRFTSRDALV